TLHRVDELAGQLFATGEVLQVPGQLIQVRRRVGEQPRLPGRATRRVQGRIIGQDRLVQAGERRAGPQPELAGEQLPELVVLGERLGPPATPVERDELRD